MLDILKMLHLQKKYLWSRKMKMDLDCHRHICILFAALFLCWLNLPSESRLFYKITNDNLSQQKYKSIENKFSSYSSLLSYMFPRCPDFSCSEEQNTWTRDRTKSATSLYKARAVFERTGGHRPVWDDLPLVLLQQEHIGGGKLKCMTFS